MKKINFLGIPVNVMDDADVEQVAEQGEEHHYLVMRVADTDPNAGSYDLRRRRLRTPCEICQEVCWFDPKSFDQLGAMKMIIICSVCMIKKVQAEEQEQS